MKNSLINRSWRKGMLSALLFTAVAVLTARAAGPVIVNADFEDTIPGSNKPAGWTDIGGNTLAMNNDGGTLNLNLPNASRTLTPATFRGAAQNIDLTGVQYLTFDAACSAAAPNFVRAVVRIDGVEVWSTAAVGTYHGQLVDVSAYPGVRAVSFRIEATVSATTAKPSGIPASFHFDNVGTASPDVTAPTVEVTAATRALWAPNHKLVNVGLNLLVSDDRDNAPAVAVYVYSNEPNNAEGDGNTEADAAVGNGGVSVRAERSGQGAGRVYLIVVEATDAAGNVGYDCVTVVVPKSRSKADVEAAAAAALAAEELCLENGAAPAGWHLLN